MEISALYTKDKNNYWNSAPSIQSLRTTYNLAPSIQRKDKNRTWNSAPSIPRIRTTYNSAPSILRIRILPGFQRPLYQGQEHYLEFRSLYTKEELPIIQHPIY